MRVAAKVPSDQQLCFEHKQVSLGIPNETCWRVYCTELATEEKTLFALLPTRRIVPTTITRITASITAYSATSGEKTHLFSNSFQLPKILPPLWHLVNQRSRLWESALGVASSRFEHERCLILVLCVLR